MCLPYLKCSDPLPETHFFIWPRTGVKHYVRHLCPSKRYQSSIKLRYQEQKDADFALHGQANSARLKHVLAKYRQLENSKVVVAKIVAD